MYESQTLNAFIFDHCNKSMDNAVSAERYPLWKRACPGLNDIGFIRLGMLRCISLVDSGRHFLQATEEVHEEQCPLSTYFKSLKSPRRVRMLEAVEQQSYDIYSETLSSHGIDYLKSFPELNDYTVLAADGHFIDHACHTEKVGAPCYLTKFRDSCRRNSFTYAANRRCSSRPASATD
ncbi:hypothetical protein [Bathymodiolus platifrons methanotrophic gill symbiont]|uniref:hypothetical protein n=1 Tax=Bathymodiolus platifrons methanotrophic gill symbiont TaxID=113268 RepID=UPI001C8E94A7|nr:hypothetical protein [Bathymodiolus platifrons methanotrophic gill symbiont]